MATVTSEKLTVPLLDLRAQYEQIEPEIMEAIRDVCASQRFILGPRVRALEEQVAAYSHSRHGVGVSSGTDALLVALMALGVGPGDEVITTRSRSSRPAARWPAWAPGRCSATSIPSPTTCRSSRSRT